MDYVVAHPFTPVVLASLAVGYVLYSVYAGLAGPLAHVPGPALTKFTAISSRIRIGKGTRSVWLKQLHDQYGPIVRVAPGEVSVADLEATKEIHKTAGGFLKSDFYQKFVSSPIITTFNAIEPADHSRWRRLIGNVMAESTIKSFDPVIQERNALLIEQLKKEYAAEGRMDIYKWFHFFATDVIGELSFGESFRMLEIGRNNEYMDDIQKLSKLNIVRMAITSRRLHEFPRIPIWPLSEMFRRADNLRNYGEQSLSRYEQHMALNPEEPRPMFFSRIMGDKGKNASLSREEIVAQAQGFLIAGTDTTAVTSSYLVWSLCRPEHQAQRQKLLKLIADLPEDFSNEDLREITYLDHLMNETLRLYGAAPAPLPRVVPSGGRTLGGHFIPEGQVASPVAYVLHRNADIYPDPEAWIPERWENPTKEMKDAFHAFGGGSRVCSGLHLAKMEMRSLVVNFFKNFPNAQVAYGKEGFEEADMEMAEFFLIRPKGKRCLLR